MTTTTPEPQSDAETPWWERLTEASGDTETLSGTRNGATGQVCSDDGDGICANLYVESSTSLRFEVVSCDSSGACDEDQIGSIGVLPKVY